MDLVTRFGPIPLHRVCQDPPPGTASESDVVRLKDRTNRLFELVDGTLLEKAMGTFESYLSGQLFAALLSFVEANKLGIVLPADGMLRLVPGLVRIPDVSFISWDRYPGADQFAKQAIAEMVPDLAVEIISRSNTDEEMALKLHEYFRVGVRAVWYVYPERRQVHVHSTPDQLRELTIDDQLEGGEVLPGFSLDLAQLFTPPEPPSAT